MAGKQGGGRDTAMFFFTNDWMSDELVQAMDLEQRGAYHWLLCVAWNQGSIPADPALIAGILKVTPARFRKIWAVVGRCWESHPDDPDRLVNRRQEKERVVRAEVSRKRSEAGKAGGQASGESRRSSDWPDARKQIEASASAAPGKPEASPAPKRSPSPVPSPSTGREVGRGSGPVPEGGTGPPGTSAPEAHDRSAALGAMVHRLDQHRRVGGHHG